LDCTIIIDAVVFDVEIVLLACRFFSDMCSFDLKKFGNDIEVSCRCVGNNKIPSNFEEVFRIVLLEQKVRHIIDKKCAGMRDRIVEMAFSHF
jgi:His-Xaa-Ser system protein HxsD